MSHDICLDANVFLACLTPEAAQQDCLNLMERAEGRGMYFFEPALVLYEVASSLHRKVQRQEMTVKALEAALDLFFQLPLLLQWQAPLMKKAASMARRLRLTTSYDCSYLALAENRRIPLITLDQDLQKKGRHLYPQVFGVVEFTRKFL